MRLPVADVVNPFEGGDDFFIMRHHNDGRLRLLRHAGMGFGTSVVPALTALTVLAALASDVVLIRTAVTLHTIVEIANAFFHVFTPNVGGRVFMATIAGVAAVVVAHVAGNTRGVVVAVQQKVFVVVKGRGSPLLLGVALCAIAGDLLVQRIRG